MVQMSSATGSGKLQIFAMESISINDIVNSLDIKLVPSTQLTFEARVA